MGADARRGGEVYEVFLDTLNDADVPFLFALQGKKLPTIILNAKKEVTVGIFL